MSLLPRFELPKEITKRDGRVTDFDKTKIFSAVKRCFQNGLHTSENTSNTLAEQITNSVLSILKHKVGEVRVEEVQRLVIQQMWAMNHFEAAEHYTLYREQRRQDREKYQISSEHQSLIDADSAHFQTPLQYFTFLDKYARWSDENKRRETWRECCTRVMNFFRKQPQLAPITEEEWNTLDTAMFQREVSPAMRIVQMAGPPLDRCNSGSFNCCAVAIDDLLAFPEALYLLMQGCGVGFSVESEFVDCLPRIKKQKGSSVTKNWVVEDSTEGWCDALKEGLFTWVVGEDITYDFSLVRPYGARLRTKGGRASGPEPLIHLLNFARNIFLKRQGGRLTTRDCHDLMCVIGKIVHVGGVRRSAEISLSDLDDLEMRNAKSGNWWDVSPWLDASNNSTVYSEKPSSITFMEEWLALAKSGSGERGIFNRLGATKHIPKRRRKGVFILNPCITGETWVMTSNGAFRAIDLVGKPFNALVNGKPYSSSGFFQTGYEKVFKVTLNNGMCFRATKNHKILVVNKLDQKHRTTKWVQVSELTEEHLVVIHNHRGAKWGGRGTESEGYLLGSLLGDRCFGKKDQGMLCFWGDYREVMRDKVVFLLHNSIGARVDCQGYVPENEKSRVVVQSSALGRLATKFGIDRTKRISEKVELASSSFYAGFLRGWFDADGTVIGIQNKGISVRLSSSKLFNLKKAQRMLARLGINSTIYENRQEAGYREMPDGRGGTKNYWCAANHELAIANDNIIEFAKIIGFGQPDKQEKLLGLISKYRRKPNRDRFVEKVVSVVEDGEEEVYDCSVPGVSAFDANGVYVHNCAEILLRSSQMCNLSIVIAKYNDTIESLEGKTKLATIFGTIQSTLTNFKYLRPIWKTNCDTERLLGTDITGQMDCPLLRPNAEGREQLLRHLRGIAFKINVEYAERLEIPISAAITTVKPSGNSSAFFGCSSGLHSRWAKYCIRRVRVGMNSPMAKLLKSEGVPWAVDPLNESLLVFDFLLDPAPEGTPTRNELTAIEQFHNWLVWNEHWTEHSPSCTIYVAPDEWLELGNEVYKNFDKIGGGVSFLPKDGGTYRLAPYEEITQEEYEKRLATFPKINWAKLSRFESDDYTTGREEIACSAGACEF